MTEIGAAPELGILLPDDGIVRDEFKTSVGD
jgi:hypothetical protein